MPLNDEQLWGSPKKCNVIERSDGLDFRIMNSEKTCNLPSAGVGIWREKGGSMTTVNPCAQHLAALMEYPCDDAHYSWFQLISADPVEQPASGTDGGTMRGMAR